MYGLVLEQVQLAATNYILCACFQGNDSRTIVDGWSGCAVGQPVECSCVKLFIDLDYNLTKCIAINLTRKINIFQMKFVCYTSSFASAALTEIIFVSSR